MNAPESTSKALARILALPVAVGLLAGCDYASKLPDAPATLGYELQSQKPPSVTGIEPEQFGPPPAPVGVAAAPRPEPLSKQARIQVPDVQPDLNTRALAVPSYQPEAAAPRTALVVPEQPTLPFPGQAQAPQSPPTGLARIGTVGTPPDTDLGGRFIVTEQGIEQVDAPAPAPQFAPLPNQNFETFETVEYQAPEFQSLDTPSFEPAPLDPLPFESYEPLPFESTQQTVQTQPIESYAVASAPAQLLPQNSQTLYSAPPLAAPLPIQSQGFATSPISVLHARLPNGAIVKVHPVVGAPGATSGALSRTIATELGAMVDASEVANAPAVFDLRASASRDGSRADAEWKLFSSTGGLVGAFPESQSGTTWSTMGDDALRAMGRRVADRLRRNADLRRATLTSLASAPSIANPSYSLRLASGAPSLAPQPRRRPSRNAEPIYTIDTTAPAAAPQFVTPRPRPEGIRTAALSPIQTQPVQTRPIQPQPIFVQPQPQFQPVAPQPVVSQPIQPQPQPLSTAPLLQAPQVAIAPPPSFETLRPAGQATAPSGPSALVFRGVRGAPGDGDQALTREVSRLLAQSGAQLAPQGTPNALYLTADVTRTRTGAGDQIKIIWHVEDGSGERIGQVVQENEVPAGQLDASWGEDAFYAAEGARNGIMELLRTSGAIGA